MAMGGLVVLGGFACDVGFIAVTRWALRISSRSYYIGKIVAVVVVNFLASLVLFVGSLLIARRLSEPWLHAKWKAGRSSSLLMGLGFSNSIDTLAPLVFFLLVLILLGHRVFWPLLSRPLYALQDLGITRRRKFFGAIGLGLLALAGFKVPELFKKVLETLFG